ncbi:hypothetical protein SODALDRAFT_358988 [Sodiomyces alkalinus F11]|uniref:Uncharacterized protein n=1 Tax=Sodiomyces alkalinus (strain CBS 110278 / VKM F-3762 / F11) TaxID=1314773 RepID=A0A3N2PXC7_SODAK|nr:hypothetical protein SODALDRAFT_358988 [Sodiomyces alkalinus F11]ROT39124.1 hypothetical protein SODALDRAFT_358988 [Sodiomyces alkalinus F11]
MENVPDGKLRILGAYLRRGFACLAELAGRFAGQCPEAPREDGKSQYSPQYEIKMASPVERSAGHFAGVPIAYGWDSAEHAKAREREKYDETTKHRTISRLDACVVITNVASDAEISMRAWYFMFQLDSQSHDAQLQPPTLVVDQTNGYVPRRTLVSARGRLGSVQLSEPWAPEFRPVGAPQRLPRDLFAGQGMDGIFHLACLFLYGHLGRIVLPLPTEYPTTRRHLHSPSNLSRS